MSIVKSSSAVDTSNLQTELDHTKEKLENYIIKKENEYVVLWNSWYAKCEECKYNKILYDKAYNYMQQKIERLQAQLGYIKGKCKDTPCVSDTLDPLSQKLENESVELEFQVLNYAKENEHLKTTYKNLFDSIKVTRAQTKLITDSLHEKLHDTIYENATSRAQLFDKVSEQKDTTKGTSSKVLPKIDESNALSKPITSNSAPSTHESPVVKNNKVIAPRMFRINPFKTSKEDTFMPINQAKVSVRINPITFSQLHVITKKHVNSDSNGLFSVGVDNTAKTRRTQPRSNTKNDWAPCASKSSCIKNKEVENDKFEVVCAICKQCLITANHDVCVLNYVNGMNSHGKKQKANVSNIANQTKLKLMVRKPNQVGFKERLASPKISQPRTCLRWSPNGRIFDLKGKIIASSKSECHSDISIGTVRFRNDHIAAILGYGDLQWGNILITRVYFVEGLWHNLFSVGQFCDSALEVAFRRKTCFVMNLEGVDLLKGNHTTNLYTINLYEMAFASPIYLMARATSTKS
ncbi:hypothetical protein Tco_1354169 [Tanacetum coccineum]